VLVQGSAFPSVSAVIEGRGSHVQPEASLPHPHHTLLLSGNIADIL